MSRGGSAPRSRRVELGLVLTGFVVLGVATTWALGGFGAEGSEAGSSDVDRLGGSGSAETAGLDAGALPGGPAKPTEAGVEEGDFEREVDLENAFFKVRVTDAAGAPVANARVRYIDRKARDAAVKRRPSNGRFCEYVEAFGKEARTDATGHCGMPKFERSMWVAASKDTRFGFRLLHTSSVKGGRTIQIKLVPDVTLTAAVVGPDAQPVPDFEIGLYELRAKRSVRTLAKSRTDSAGVLTLPHFQLYGAGKRWLLTPTAPFDPAPHVVFTSSEAASQQWQLRVPAFGSIAVRVVGPARRVLLGAATATLTLQRQRQWKIGSSKISIGSKRVSRKAGSDELVFQPVGVGLRFRIDLRLGAVRKRATVTGPGSAGERRSVTVVLDPKTTILSATIAGTSSVSAYLLGPKNWALSRSVQLGKGGHFELSFVPSLVADYELFLRDTTGRQLRTVVAGLRRGEHRELGRLELERPGPLLSGRVVDDMDKPVANANLTIERYQPTGKRWRSVPNAKGSSDSRGAFAIRAARAPGRLRVRVSASRHLQALQACTGGEKELLVRLERSASLTLNARVPTSLKERLTAQLVRTGVKKRLRARPRKGKASWTFSGLKRGSYQLQILFVKGIPPLLERGVQLEPGKNGLGTVVDLTSRMHTYSFVVRRAATGGKSRGKARAYLYVRGTNGAMAKRLRLSSKKVTMVWPLPNLEGELVERGMRPQRLALSPGHHVVELARGPTVRLELPGLRAAIGKSQAWVLARPKTTPFGSYTSSARSQLDNTWGTLSGDTCTLHLPATGTYALRLRVMLPYKGRSISFSWGRSAEVELGQIDVPGDATRRLTLDTAAIRKAIKP